MLTTWRSEPAPDKQKEMSFEQFKEVSSVRMKGLGKNLDESVLKMHYHRTKRAQRWQEMIDKKDPLVHLTLYFLIFYVCNSTSATCESIFFSVIVDCVMMRWKMNENFSKITCSNAIFSI